MSRGHVLHVFEPAIGGVPAYVGLLAEGLVRRGWRVSVAGPASSPVTRTVKGYGAHFVPLRTRYRPAPSDARVIFQLARLCRRTGIELIHGHSTKAGLLAGISARIAGVPSIYTPHTWVFDRHLKSASMQRLYAGFERNLARHCHRAILLVSEHERRAAHAWRIDPRGGMHVVSTGLRPREGVGRGEARARLALDHDAFVTVWVGRRHAAKRPQDLAPLARQLRANEIELVSLGDGLQESPEGRAFEKAGGRIVAPGTHPDIVYAAADVFVQTSAWEGLSLAVLEAMSAGLPVVAYGVGGVAEQVEEGRTGHVVGRGEVDELAKRVIELARAPEKRARMGSTARERLDRCFCNERMLESVERIYEDALAEPTGGGRSD